MVTAEIAEGVGKLTLNRPDCRNAVDAATIHALHTSLDELTEDPRCNVIVLCGEGEAFCAGWDLRQLDVLRDLPGRALEEVFESARAFLAALADAPQVTICSVQGAALGFGLSVVAACDLAVAARDTRFGLPEVRSGVVPAFVLVDLVDVLPAKQALDWLLTGELQDAEAALAAGLVSRLTDDDVTGETMRLAGELATRPRAQLSATKHHFRIAARGVTSEVVTSTIRLSAAQINGGPLAAEPGRRER